MSSGMRNATGPSVSVCGRGGLTFAVPPSLWSRHHECKSASSSADLCLSAVKAATLLRAAVQYKHFPFSPVPGRAHEPAKKKGL